MSYFLSEDKLSEGKVLTLTGVEARHILASRRMKPGETFHLQGPDEVRHLAMFAERKGKSALVVQIGPIVPAPPEPLLHITLCQALVAEQPLDLIIQKATELGVARVLVFPATRSPYHLPPTKVAKKLERWRAIATEAAKQCDRLRGVNVAWVSSLNEGLENVPNSVERFSLSQHAKQSLALLLRSKVAEMRNEKSASIRVQSASICVYVGPEGGWSEEEHNLFKTSGIPEVTLGPRVLRAETAAIAAAIIIQSLAGDMG
ncbi:MAG: hypothetical protein COV10_04485 [Candidatus Vogelbacteria bacterium CG10_big_fil_rev_8_21_14_0_10_51_16]|uniref:Ribosomal RNA small subunit methyltransferase E n=1 Tax=Candidatus Vogelbacteria bacterium CG10_big_fil_rev_8_21_14_0_10_51_16 TaxID=1975045 RepID=A0A2H0RDD3_9BACT|nr:MAG: hypothetical protein COV10_04485 [Candidatus Vogelbacteria bacterium CG10_big_fil_rev_8_21_14_0_10_51_16]